LVPDIITSPDKETRRDVFEPDSRSEKRRRAPDAESPRGANGINKELAEDLDHAASKCETDPAVRAVLISGAGKMFCAGGDLKAFASKSEADLPRYLEDVTAHLHRAVSRFARMRSPVVAAVHGSAAGAGFSLTCAVDFVIAAESAKFTMAYTKAGSPPMVHRHSICRGLLGLDARWSLQFSIQCSQLSRRSIWESSHAWFPTRNSSRLRPRSPKNFATGPTLAYRGVKRLLIDSAVAGLEEQMGRETETICAAAWTKDAREGIAASSRSAAPNSPASDSDRSS